MLLLRDMGSVIVKDHPQKVSNIVAKHLWQLKMISTTRKLLLTLQ